MVTGAGSTSAIAQNGIEYLDGATGKATDNSVSGNNYTGTGNASSAGILVYGGCGSPLIRDAHFTKNTLTGLLPLEMFVDGAGNVLVNEIAPRPHNSGHWTIDACPARQFELHIRAIAGLPLPPATPAPRPAENPAMLMRSF